MRVMRLIGAVFVAALMLSATAWAAELDLPGLARDSEAYASALRQIAPAGATVAMRQRDEQRALDAAERKDWAAAVAAWERRLGEGDVAADQWLALAEAELNRPEPDARRALMAAWLNFEHVEMGTKQIPGLLLMAKALRLQQRPVFEYRVLSAIVERAPENAAYRDMLQEARRTAGLLVNTVRTEAEAEPARACLGFTVAPSRRPDWQPADWVKLDPPAPEAAVTREGDGLCISGLPLGAETKVMLRAGLPGEGGIDLKHDDVVTVAMPNRRPRVVFDTRLFVLPRGQAPALRLTTVNLSSVALKLMRVTERNVVPFVRDNELGKPVDTWTAKELENGSGSLVWSGKAAIPKWRPNELSRTALPLPEPLVAAGPGLFALLATAGDGTPAASDAGAVQMILRTDLAPSVWRGSDGLTVQVRGYSDAHPVPDVKLELLARNNDVLATAMTDANGLARFPAPLLHGEGPLEAFAIFAFAGQDFAAINLSTAAFDLSDRGVQGRPQPGPLDAFIWLDRGIFRPGETANVMALLRSNAGEPVNVPVHVIVRRPNGQVFLDTTPPRQADAALHVPVALSRTAAAGTWTVEIRPDPKAPPIGHAEFRVEAFVPDRMAVDLGPANGPIVAGKPYSLPVSARFLYGAPAANLSGSANMRLAVDPEPFPSLAGYRVGLVTETFAPNSVDLSLPETDAEGHASLPIALSSPPDTTYAVKAEIGVEVNDPSGHAARAEASVPVRPAGKLIGIKPLFGGDAVDAGTEAAFDVIAVDPDGKRVATPAKLRLVREIPDWQLVMQGRLAHYEMVWRDQPLETHDVGIPADRPLHFAKRLDFGRYRLEVLEANGLAASSVRFRSGWTEEDNPDVPDRADVMSDRREYRPGESARIHIAAPFGGEASVLVLTDRVLSVQNVAVAADGTDVTVPVEASWGPGAYVTVHVFHTGTGEKERPRRAIGLTWVGVDPSARTIATTISAPERTRPRGQTTVSVHTAPGAWVTLAAVDEGILRLTKFANPDPIGHFLGRRRLGVDIRDDWGRLIPPASGTPTLLRQGAGGDEGAEALPIPQVILSLFTPPVHAGADGVATIPLSLPDFNGQARLMTVTWAGNRMGAAATDMFIRDPLVAEPLLPRFLAPGDDARLAVLLHNVELPGGETAVTLSADGAVAISGPTRLSANLAHGQQTVQTSALHAADAGRGHIHLDVTGPSGFHVARDSWIVVRPARGAVTAVASTQLQPGAETRIDPATDQFVPGTWRASASFGTAVRYDAGALLTALDEYRFSCLEQETSRGFPLALLPNGAMAGADRAARLAAAVQSVLDRQRYDGGFGLWSASDAAQPWLSAYATEFLLHARDAGATVPQPALQDALKFLTNAAEDAGDKPEDQAAQAYRLYVLALAGQPRSGAARVMAASLDSLPTPLARAQVGASLALSNDNIRAEAAFTAALNDPKRDYWGFDYGDSLRDQLAIAFLLKRSGVLPDRLKALLAELPGQLTPDSTDTQQQAWAVAAAAALGAGAKPAHVAVDGRDLLPAPLEKIALTGPASVRNVGDAPVWQTVSVTGVPKVAPPAAKHGMRISRQFFTTDGKPLDLDNLRQNTVFVLLLEGKAEDGQAHHALALHGLPAGWEIAGRFNRGEVPGMDWLGKLSTPLAQPSGDDRFAAAIDLTPDEPDFRVAVRVRAVTPGSYALPGAELIDMYRPGVFARQAEGRITILPAK